MIFATIAIATITVRTGLYGNEKYIIYIDILYTRCPLLLLLYANIIRG